MKVSPRCSKTPKERNLGGDRVSSGLNPLASIADRRPDQSPGGEASCAGADDASRRQATRVNDRRAQHGDEPRWLGGGNKPLKGESRTWQWDETSPRGCGERKPSRVCETPRAERRARLGSSLASGSPQLMSRLGRKPQGRRSSHPCVGQVRSGSHSEEEAKLRGG
jgi:hypothetical protein